MGILVLIASPSRVLTPVSVERGRQLLSLWSHILLLGLTVVHAVLTLGVDVHVGTPASPTGYLGRLRRRGDWGRLSVHVIERVEGGQHGPREVLSILTGGEVEAVHLATVSPLVECRGRLVVLEPLQDGAVDDHLMVLDLPADHPEGVVDGMLVDLHLGDALRAATRHPLLVAVVVDHHRRPRRDDGHLTHFVLIPSFRTADFN